MTNSEMDRIIAKREAVKDYTNARDDFAMAALMQLISTVRTMAYQKRVK